MPYPLTLEDLITQFYENRRGRADRLRASDSSWFPRANSIRYLQDQIARAAHEHADDAMQKIFGGNAARLFRDTLGTTAE